jgi:hypothetical protein
MIEGPSEQKQSPVELEPEHPGSRLFETLRKNRVGKALMCLADALALASALEVGRAIKNNVENEAEARQTIEVLAKEGVDVEALKAEIGSESLDKILSARSIAQDGERATWTGYSTEASGLEGEGVTNQQMESLTKVGLPPSFHKNIRSVEFTDRSFLTRKSIGGVAFNDSDTIRLYRDGFEKADASRVMNVYFVHEAAHQQDWESNHLLTVQERIELLQATVDRLKSPDHYRTAYIEKLEADASTPKDVLAREYFAEVMMAHLNGNVFLNDADKALVHQVLDRTDPGLDLQAINDQRILRQQISDMIQQHRANHQP